MNIPPIEVEREKSLQSCKEHGTSLSTDTTFHSKLF